jgi:hypothetical protein
MVRRIAALPVPAGEGTVAEEQPGRRKKADREVYEKPPAMRHFQALTYPEEAEPAPSRAAGDARDGKDAKNCSNGGGGMYTGLEPGGKDGNPG